MGAPVINASTGYVRLYRKLLQNPIFRQLAPAVSKVAIFFLLRANYRASQWYDGSSAVDIPAGSFITSYSKTAEACNLSVQQVRDAFSHLSGTHFATYTRTKRWTLVTVLNWATHQASEDEAEHTEEHTVDRVRNRKGTTDKEVKKERSIPGAESAPESAALFVVGTAQPTEESLIADVASRMYARHPRVRRCGQAEIRSQLAAIVRKVPKPGASGKAGSD